MIHAWKPVAPGTSANTQCPHCKTIRIPVKDGLGQSPNYYYQWQVPSGHTYTTRREPECVARSQPGPSL